MWQEGVEELNGLEGVRVVWDFEGGEELGIGEEERGKKRTERAGLGRL